MDDRDAKILQILANDGKATHSQIAEKVGLSLSACQRRVKELESRGIIAGYRATIAPAYLGEGQVVLVGINLASHSRADIQAFQKAIVRLPMVKDVYHIAGEYDYLLKVAVADIPAFEDFHADQLAAIPQIAKITSFVSMSTLKV
jgi:Lrp/AsnC family leucine-responsive transcriptional regulator